MKKQTPLLAPLRYHAREGDKPDTIAVILYERTKCAGWQPSAVVTLADNNSPDYYDFDWCEKDEELCCHISGGGGEYKGYDLGDLCDKSRVQLKIWYDRTRTKLWHQDQEITTNAEANPLGYEILNEPLGDPFEDALQETPVEYCTQCRSYFNTERTCRHLRYLEGSGFYLGCGANDTDLRQTQRSLYRLLDVLPTESVEAMRHALASSKFACEPRDDLHCRNASIRLTKPFRGRKGFDLEFDPLLAEHEGEERYWPGIAWLMSIDRTTKEAWALTLGWLWQWQREDWHNHCVLGNLTFIRHLDNAMLDEWLAIDPHDPATLHDRPLIIKVPFKAQCANDHQFIADPTGTNEVLLWPKNPGTDPRSLKLSVAEVKRGPKEVHLYFGRVLERNRQHISELEGYELIS